MRIAAIAALLALAGIPFAMAQQAPGGLTVFPVTVQLAPGQRTRALTIQNHRDTPLAFQVRAFAWSQVNGTDVLTPTDAVIVSPPLGNVAAGANQVVRLVLRRPAQATEEAFRILVDEIPRPAQPGMINIALRLSVPVFSAPATRAAPHLQWHVEVANGQADLVVLNDGNSHASVRDIAVRSATGKPLVLEGGTPYVLAGAPRRWRIVTPDLAPSSGESLHLTAHTDDGNIEQVIATRDAGG